MRVIGVDPGTLRVGFSLLEEGRTGRRLLASGTIVAPRKEPIEQRLKIIFEALTELIATHQPDQMAVEGLFFGKNVASTIKIGEGRAVALLAAAQAGITVHEYAPREVKKATVGHGGAAKYQVARMVQAALGLAELPQPDEADAIAIGLTHLNRATLRSAQNKT